MRSGGELGNTALIWLHLLREGGWWTAQDVLKAVHAIRTPYIAGEMSRMARHGLLVCRQVDGQRKPRYGVTGACSVPMRLPMRYVIEAQSRLAAASEEVS